MKVARAITENTRTPLRLNLMEPGMFSPMGCERGLPMHFEYKHIRLVPKGKLGKDLREDNLGDML